VSACDVGKSENPTFLVLFPVVFFLSENAKVPLNKRSQLFASVFTGKCSNHTAQVTEGKVRDWENEELCT